MTRLHLVLGAVLLATLAPAPPAGWGFGLPGVYLWTIVVLALLYPACRWYGDFRARTGWRVLSYL